MTGAVSAQRRKGRVTAAVMCGAIAVAAAAGTGGYVVGRTMVDPVTVNAAVNPITIRAVQYRVVKREVAETLQCAGSVTPNIEALRISGEGAGLAVLTEVRIEPEKTLTPFSVIAAAGDRPIMVASGDFAMYRDLKVGDRGRDVRQLHDAMRSAGMQFEGVRSDAVVPATIERLGERLKKAGFDPWKDHIPANELLFARGVGRPVHEVGMKVGDRIGPDTTLLKTRTGTPDVSCKAEGVAAQSVSAGMRASAKGAKQPVEGTVASVASQRIQFAGDGLNALQPGPVTLQITLRATDGPVVCVPITALRTRGSDRTVEVVTGDSTQQRTVRVGLTADGLAEIVDGLREGDTILVPT